MKITKIFAVASLSVAMLLPSCKKSFLDVEPVEYISEVQKEEYEKNPEILAQLLDAQTMAIYNALYERPLRGGDCYFGLRAWQLATDMMCEDIAYQNYNWFEWDYQLDFFNAPWGRTAATWKTFYNVVATSNRILANYFEGKKITSKELLSKEATIRGLRGLAYFNLVNAYQFTYKGHEDALGVPLVLKPSDSNLPRAKVKDVYAQIIKDLTFAVDNGVATDVRTDFDKNVAAAFLAKVYAQMEEWEQVVKYAGIAKSGAMDVVSAPCRAWNVEASPDILFGYSVNETNTALWGSFYSHVDIYQPCYAGAGGNKKMIYSNLYAAIPKTDSRRKLFISPELFKFENNQVIFIDTEIPELKEEQALYRRVASKTSLPPMPFDQLKYANTGEGCTGDYCYLRVQDPILLEIEGKIELNQLGEAEALLNAFVQKRNPQFVAPKTQDELRQAVRLERRIELWMEGTSFLDVRRWKVPCNRPKDSNHGKPGQYNLGDPFFVFELPQFEMDANPNLVQNAR